MFFAVWGEVGPEGEWMNVVSPGGPFSDPNDKRGEIQSK